MTPSALSGKTLLRRWYWNWEWNLKSDESLNWTCSFVNQRKQESTNNGQLLNYTCLKLAIKCKNFILLNIYWKYLLLNSYSICPWSNYTTFSPQSYQEDHSGVSSHRVVYWLLMWLVSFLCISIKPVEDSVHISQVRLHNNDIFRL